MFLATRRRFGVAIAVAGAVVAAAASATNAVPHHVTIAAPPQPHVLTATRPAGAAVSGAVLRSNGPGYVLGVAGLLGYTPTGLHVWVDRSAPQHADLARDARFAVHTWKRLGIPSSYQGYGHPKSGDGVVTVTEGPAGCRGGENRAGNTWQQWMPLPDGHSYVTGARVVICPQLYRLARWQWRAVTLHELGHAAGLGHFNGVYDGTTQVMRAVDHPGVSTYKAGDLNGMRFLASHKVLPLIPARGALGSATFAGNQVVMTGWALMTYAKDQTVKIVVYNGGTQIASTTTNVVRLDVNRKQDPGSHRPHGFQVDLPIPSGTVNYCVKAVSPFNSAVTTDLGCAMFSD